MSLHNLKGFCVFNDLADNNDDKTAAIGELSATARTFSRNIQTFSGSSNSYSDLLLEVFSYRDDNGDLNGSPVPANVVDDILPILDWINTGSRDGTIGMDVVTFNNQITAQFGSAEKTLTASQMFSANIGGTDIVVPVKLTVTDTSALDYSLNIWFVNTRFELEYGEYTYRHLMPTDPIDILTSTEAEVTAAIGDWDTAAYNAKIDALAEGKPFTKVVVTKLVWHQLDDNRITRDIEFSTLVWGAAGDNIEFIRADLIREILKKSVNPESDWVIILPDLFIQDEFTIVPRWDKIAIQPVQTMAALYSPIATYGEMSDAFKYMPTYSEAHVTANLQSLPFLWQSVCCFISGGTRNSIKGSKFTDTYGDFILASPGSFDSDRMSDATRQVVALLSTMIPEAEKFTDDGSYTPPQDIGTVIRNELIYLQGVVDGSTLLVLTKHSYDSIPTS